MAYRRVLFVDTCSFHHMRLYHDFARKLKLIPLSKNRKDPSKEIKRSFPNSRTAQDLEYGYKLLMYLKDECKKGSEIQFAPLTTIEMTCGMLRGKAIIKMAGNLAPNRILSRIDENEVLKLLLPSDYAKVSKSLKEMLNSFQRLGIVISEVNAEKSKEAYPIAFELLNLVYLDVIDLIIYAYAFVIQADELLTQDGYFARIAGGIENLGALPKDLSSDQFTGIQKILRKKLSDLIGSSTAQGVQLKFPKVKKIK